MSTSGSTEEPVGEVRRRRVRDQVAEPSSAPEGPPMSRREMKARGILLTTEIPVIQEPPGWGGGASAAATAHRAGANRTDAGRAVSAVAAAPVSAPVSAPAGMPGSTAGSASAAPLPSRRALRESRQLSSPNRADKAEAQTATGRRPVVKAPLTARGLRTVDESGSITGVHSAIGQAVGRAIESATSPASWESAVSMPAVALGIEDIAGAPIKGGTVTAPQRDEDVVEDVAPDESQDVAPDESQDVAPDESQDVAPALGAAGSADASRLAVTEGVRSIASDARVEMEERQTAARRSIHEAARRQAGLHRAEPKRSGRDVRGLAVRIGWIVAIVVAIVVLVYLVSTGALSSLFAQGPDGLGFGAGTLAVAVGALWMPRALHQAAVDPSPEEIRDR